MGIPKFFRYITNKYSNIIIDNIDGLDNLFFDLNCLIHPCVQAVIKNHPDLVNSYNSKVLSPNLSSITRFETKVYEEISKYLLHLITFSNPRKLIYLAIDGVAPRSKMKQQRSRRFRSILEKKMKKQINYKYDKKTIEFDTNCITPGTVFMKKLSNFLKIFIDDIQPGLGIKIILSDSGLRGEGEHKILQYMKVNCAEDINCIYGLDADLIMLALINGCPKSYLLREAIHFGKVDMEELLFFNVELFSEKLYMSIKEPIIRKYTILHQDSEDLVELELNKNSIIKDFICLCFLIGNDFLPHIPGLDINNKGIDKLQNIYINNFIVKPYYLVKEDNSLNFIFLKQIIIKLYDMEASLLNEYQRKSDRFRPRLDTSTKYDTEISKLKFYPIFNKTNTFKFTDANWRDKYYKYYFNITNSNKNQDLLYAVCKNYIDGLQWNCNYYFDKCISYSWYYQYSAAPTLKDLCKYLIKRVYPPTFKNIEFTPLEQLAIVLPKESEHLWCSKYRDLSNTDATISINYPKKFKLDLINKKYFHECEPLLYDVENEYIKKLFSNISLNKLELILNEKTELYIKS